MGLSPSKLTEGYFVITDGEDGIDVQCFTKEELLKEITPDEDGYTSYKKFLSQMPKIDKGCFYGVGEDAALIIKGKIIVPQVKKQVKVYDVEED